MSFNSLRKRIMASVILGVFIGGLLGAQLGQELDSQWGDLVGAVTGMWLGGPIAALIVFQLFISKLQIELSLIKARTVNFLLTLTSSVLLLVAFAAIARTGLAEFLVFPIIIGFNLLFSYANLIGSIRIATK